MIKKQKQNREIVYGINTVEQVIEAEAENIISAWVIKGRDEEKKFKLIIESLNNLGIKIQYVQRHFLDEKSQGGVHQGILLEIKSQAPKNERDLEDLLEDDNGKTILILDAITDPRNLGACMRSALASDALCVVVPKDKSAPFSPAARKAASGASSKLPLIAVTNLARTIEFLKDKGYCIIGLDANCEQTIYQMNLKAKVALVMGNEESGMRRLTREKCDFIAKIPMNEQSESLNVSVAAGIALFEGVRQRLN